MITATTRLMFRMIAATDRDALFRIYSDRETMQYRGSKPLESIADTELMIAKTIRDYSTSGECRLAMTERETGRLIGTFLYKTRSETDCEIGYSIGKDFQGKGYGIEALNHMTGYLQQLGYTRLLATTHIANTASSKLLLKAGFRPAGEPASTDHLNFEKNL